MSQVEIVLSIAKSQVGYREGYSGGHYNNYQKYSPEVPGLEWSQNQAWCCTFCAWVAMKANVASLFPRTASCLTAVAWFKSRGRFSEYPAIGAQVFFGSGGGTHTGLIHSYDADFIYSVEGNTNDSGSPEGNGVYLRKRERRSSTVYGYGLPAYSEGVTTADPGLKGREGFTYAATASGPAVNPAFPGSVKPTKTVTVRAGQTLTAIAAAAGISLASLLALNPSVKDHPDQIHPGDSITVPAVPGGAQEPQPNSEPPAPNPDPVPVPTPVPGNTFPGTGKFGPGTNNSYVTKLGEALVKRGGGRFYKEGPGPRWTEADREATRAFQLAQGWTGSNADGIPGPTTWDYLMNGKGRSIPAATASKASTNVPAYPGRPLKYTGKAPTYDPYVKVWQSRMKARGWRIAVDGYYGPASASIAKQFQARQGLRPADGIVGPVTWRYAWTAPSR
ncbi:peptidoglycan-binding protein [Kitasatospora sp. NPDC058218]|uniref:peptidoglycan-binding protein n=1 Tax=Kitasatospora sp. NPDC058218 TaxID=3346385 RepID=UPI0036DA6D3F